MVEVIEVKDWDDLFKGGKMSQLFRIDLHEEEDLYRIAEILNLPYIFKGKNWFICSDGIFIFLYAG